MRLIGLETGDPAQFKTWDEFWKAYCAQQTNFLKHAFIQQHIIIRSRPNHFASPLGSALHDLCMKTCKDLHTPVIEGGIDMGYFEFIGYGTVIDSLAAVKKLVFETKKLSMAELIAALDCNFEGKESVRQLLLHAPSYGNNDPYADAIGKAIDLEALKFTKKYSAELGVHLRPEVRAVHFACTVRQSGQCDAEWPEGIHAAGRRLVGIARSRHAWPDGGSALQLLHQELQLSRAGSPDCSTSNSVLPVSSARRARKNWFPSCGRGSI